ncbi:DUF418 domain-containing protein [Domibacillus indicus]|uniref:DUF418 domain-containing protein n=1 Tax=Domibacillus indicus TaxID=1437523 RepID=UPI000617D9A2|nr:DUF418 domain-containing protein [Domibacillus indicus]
MKSAPLSASERILTIDIIRGFALLGIFLVNMPSFHSPVVFQGLGEEEKDFWLTLFLQMFVEAKFYTIFSFLFGLGFYIFMSRAEKKGMQTNRLFTRRLTVLLLIGTAHFILLWSGDILHTYAITGLLLLLFYKRKNKTLLVWAGSLLAACHLVLAVPFFMPNESFEQLKMAFEEKKSEEFPTYVAMYEEAGYLEWIAYRFDKEIPLITAQLPLSMLPVLAMFLLGLYAGKIGIFQPGTPYLPLVKKIWRTALLISIPLSASLAALRLSWIDGGYYQSTVEELLVSLSGFTLCFFYITSLMLLTQKAKWQKRLRPLGYVGQMALTNYLLQTIICFFLFLVLDFYGKVGLGTGTLICLVIYVLQVAYSYFWMKKFAFGPFEWLWRSLTYGYFPSIKKAAPAEKEKETKTIS